MNIEVRYSIIKKTERHAVHAPALRERCHTSKFEIPCSIFDIQLQLICGTNNNFKQNLFVSGLSGLGCMKLYFITHAVEIYLKD